MKKEQLKKGSPKKGVRGKNDQTKNQVKKRRYLDLAGLAIIILLGIIIYSDSFTCSFHFDDSSIIVTNPAIRNLANVKAWWNLNPFRPVGIFSFVLNYHFNQLDVRYWHLVNLVIHLVNACLLYWLTLLIFSSPVLKDDPIIRYKNGIAFFTALLFVSHPLATQSVTYIIQRFTSLVTMFYLLSIILYLKARVTNTTITLKYLLFAFSSISAILAMLTKQNAFTLPLAIALLELFFVRTKKLLVTVKDYRTILLMAALLGLIFIIPFKFISGLFNPLPPTFGHPYTITPVHYLFTQFSVLIKYIQLLFLPVNQNLDYDFPLSTGFFEIRTIVSFLLLLSLLILAIVFFKRNRIISFGIFWFFLTLSIESGIIPIDDLIVEHRTYLPSIGYFLIISTILFGFLGSRYKVWASVIMVSIVIVNSYLTYERNKVWRDDITLWSDVNSKSPHKARPLAIRGFAYVKLEQWDKAITDYSRAIELNPVYTEAYSDRGFAYLTLGQWDNAISDYSRVIGIDPKNTDAYSNLGVVYCKLRQWNKAIEEYSSAININPANADAYSNRGIAYCNLGQWDNALADYTRAIGIDPKNANGYYNRGNVWGSLGQWEKALADYSKTLELDPNFTEAYSNREFVYRKLHGEEK